MLRLHRNKGRILAIMGMLLAAVTLSGCGCGPFGLRYCGGYRDHGGYRPHGYDYRDHGGYGDRDGGHGGYGDNGG